MSDRLIVGLSGYARAGKNEAAEALVQYGWRPAAFADKLREFLLALNPLIPNAVDMWPVRLRALIGDVGWEYAKDHYPEVRALLQRAGTEAGRKVLGTNVWVNALFDQNLDAPALAITDVRFENEAQAVSDRGGILIRVERPGVGPATDRFGGVHVSETALDDWPFDHVLNNDGTVQELHAKLYGIGGLVQVGQSV